jgi:hypothetical protein
VNLLAQSKVPAIGSAATDMPLAKSRCTYGGAFLSDSKSKFKGDARPHNASDAKKGTDEAMPLNAQLHVACLTAKGPTTHRQET